MISNNSCSQYRLLNNRDALHWKATLSTWNKRISACQRKRGIVPRGLLCMWRGAVAKLFMVGVG